MPIRDDEKFLPNFLGNTTDEAEQRYKAYLPTIKYLAQKTSIHSGLEEEDLRSEGMVGLARAFRDFDSSRSENVRTYALYRIKDAIKEYVTKEVTNIRAPQYLRDAFGLLERLQTAVESNAVAVKGRLFCGFLAIWEESANVIGDPVVDDLKKSLRNLAARARTTPEDLIERLELIPIISEDFSMAADPVSMDDNENTIINSIDARQKVSLMKKDLNQDEYELLLDRFVEGWTIRELEDKIGVRPSTTVIRTKKIIKRLKKNDSRTRRRISSKEANGEDPIGKMKKILTASEYELIERFAVKGETIEELSNDLGIAHEAILKELQDIKNKLIEMGIGEGYENTSNTAEAAS